MLENSPIPKTFLENVHMVNTATNFFNSNKDINDINSLYNKTTNDFSPFNTNNNYNNYNTSKFNTLNLNHNKEYNNMNKNKRFMWKEINNLNYNELDNDERILENPIVKNILNSNINENEIQNMPENDLVNLIHTLQNLANNAIKNKNYLEVENKQLYHDLEMMKTNNEYLNQKNIKINQKLNQLNKQRNEEKKTMHDLIEDNNTYNYLRTKKYYCEICTNKKFKSQKYLDEHIARRHPDYINKITKHKNKKENKANIELYQKKINEMKNYFDNLIYKSIKKIQYIKINEKLNSLQNLYEMAKYYNNTSNITNINNINITNSSYQEEMTQENNSEINNNNINNNIIEEKEKEREKKTETENSASIEKTEETSKRKQNEVMEKNHGNFIHNCLLLKKKIKFIKIKKFFEPKPEDQIIPQRTKKKRKTQKNTSKLVPDSSEEPTKEENKKIEFDEEKLDKNEDNKNILKAKNENNLEENKKEEDNVNKENNENKEQVEDNKAQELTKSMKEKMNLKLKEENMINFSDEEKEKARVLNQFCLDFKSRDYDLCQCEERYYLKRVYPKDYNLDKKKVNDIIKEKVDKKLENYNTEEKTVQKMRSEMMKIYYKVSDFEDKYDGKYLYSFLNISSFLNLKDLIMDANNNNFFMEPSFFENVQYKVEEENSSEPSNNDFYFNDESKQINNEESKDFSFKIN